MSKRKDTYTKSKNIESKFGFSSGIFDKAGVIAFFKEYRNIKEMCLYSYDSTALDLIICFEKALMSTILSSQERMVIALVYGLELTYLQTKRIMGIRITDVQLLIDNAFEAIEGYLNGFKSTIKQVYPSKARTVNEYLQEVKDAIISPFDVNEDVYKSLLYMTKKSDDKSHETLKQMIKNSENKKIKDGFNIYGHDQYDVVNYPFFATSSNPKGYDFFRNQDKHFGVQATDKIENHALGLIPKGIRKSKQVKLDNDSNGGNGRGFIY